MRLGNLQNFDKIFLTDTNDTQTLDNLLHQVALVRNLRLQLDLFCIDE